MATFALIPCSKSKADHACSAREMYRPSALFRAAYLTAEYSGQQQLILSAKYGALRPGDSIEPYDLTLNTMMKPERYAWAMGVLKTLVGWLRPGDTVVSYLGERYAEFLVPELRNLGYTVDEPWQGLTQGGRLKWFADRRDSA